MKIKEVIVVEGKADRLKVLQAVQADIIETNGSAISEQTLKIIKHAAKKRGVIVLTDPDYAGERIRQIIQEAVPECKHAFLTKRQATPKKQTDNLGIEHASVSNIQRALAGVYEVVPNQKSPLTKADMIALGLIGQQQSQKKRRMLGERLNIGYPNGKQLLKRLTMFQISKQELIDTLEAIEQEVNDEKS
ncbi:MAG TPA: ribonuclease M5 [Bacillota bacterium]|nr:ribonuclease M5 [Bacillota bacterium]